MVNWTGYEKGVNLGGWFSQCDYSKECYETFITEEDFKELSGWGLDHVRIPVDYNLVETKSGERIEEGFAYLQRAVDWCGKYGLNMILDLHKTVGYSFDGGEKENGFFMNEKLQERFYGLWEEFAVRFGKYSNRVAFELLNEVTEPAFCRPWNRIADTCIKRIRKFAPDVKILVGGYWNNSVSAVKDIILSDYKNIVLNFHSYDPFIFTHQAAGWLPEFPRDFRLTFPESCALYEKAYESIRSDMLWSFKRATEGKEVIDSEYFERMFANAVQKAESHKVPLYCGEYGVINIADVQSTLNWYKMIHPVFEKYKIGRAAWTYKKKNFGLVDEHMKPILEEIKKYL